MTHRNLPLIVSMLALALALGAFLRTAPSIDASANVAKTNAKAGALFQCQWYHGDSHVITWFNNVNGKEPQIKSTKYRGHCRVNFGFNAKDRIIFANARELTKSGYGVSVLPFSEKPLLNLFCKGLASG